MKKNDDTKGMTKKEKTAYAKGEIAEKTAELREYKKMLKKPKAKKNAAKKR